MTQIAGLHARQILDSQGDPTIEVQATLAATRDLGMPQWRHLGGDGAVQLPVPRSDVINGGVHAASRLDFAPATPPRR